MMGTWNDCSEIKTESVCVLHVVQKVARLN